VSYKFVEKQIFKINVIEKNKEITGIVFAFGKIVFNGEIPPQQDINAVENKKTALIWGGFLII
jgi:hypothetical protein